MSGIRICPPRAQRNIKKTATLPSPAAAEQWGTLAPSNASNTETNYEDIVTTII
jgi:hypothetical protein